MFNVDISRHLFGTVDTPNGKADSVYQYTLEANTVLGPMSISVLEYGATLQRCVVPDASGKATDLVLGFDTLPEYQQRKAYFGATAGRYANRIARGHLTLEGNTYPLSANEGRNHLHGGKRGFDQQLWSSEITPEGDGVIFRHSSPHGDMGYPGNLTVSVTYRLLAEGGLAITFQATTGQKTVCNLVNHAYWNLNGHASGSILGQVAQFSAPFYTPVDDEQIATGEVLSVRDTPFDFQHGKPLGKDINEVSALGYDHNLVLSTAKQAGWRRCADIHSPDNGLGLRLKTTEPGVQLYTGGYLDSSVIGKGEQAYCPFAGFTLETQKFPGSPQYEHFPDSTLRPGEHYDHQMHFQFYHLNE